MNFTHCLHFPNLAFNFRRAGSFLPLNWLGIRHLFLWKNNQGFKIAYMKSQNEMLVKKLKSYFYMCKGVAGSFLENPVFTKADEHVFGILAGFLEVAVSF